MYANSPEVSTSAGLALVVIAPLFLATPLFKPLSEPETLVVRLVGQALFLSIVVGILCIVFFWENRPLSSIGLNTPTAMTLVWALVFSAILMWGVTPLSTWTIKIFRLSGFEDGLAKVGVLPIWFRILAIVITGGLFEEIVYRGFILERVAEISGSYWIAAIVSVTLFSWMHYPLWGFGPVVTFHISAAAMTGFYMWKKDLVACILAHILVDIVGLILHPPADS